MKETINRLKALNQLDLQLQTLKKDLDRLPKELAEKRYASETLKGSIERTRGLMTRLKADADGIELEVKSGEEALKRLASQMNVLRTSKEFEAVRRQMDAQRAWNKENEGKALELLEQVDAKQKEIDKNKTTLEEAEKVLAAETERVNKELAELKAKFDQITAERNNLAKDVGEKELTVYSRIAATRGVAIASVDRGNCSACFMKIPPQIHNMALLAKELVTCPSCGRILTAGN
jgi:uncharacterized protein